MKYTLYSYVWYYGEQLISPILPMHNDTTTTNNNNNTCIILLLYIHDNDNYAMLSISKEVHIGVSWKELQVLIWKHVRR